MSTYRTPGVYFEWLDPVRTDIGLARTDITGMVGIATQGPLHKPVKVESWTQFTSTFGERTPQGYLAYAVDGFFANGGRTCWVVRVADTAKAFCATLDLSVIAAKPPLKLTALTPGVWANNLLVSSIITGDRYFNLTLILPDGTQEVWRNVTYEQDDPRFVQDLLNDEIAGSRFVRIGDEARLGSAIGGVAAQGVAAQSASTVGRLSQGTDGLSTLNEMHLSGEGAPEGRSWGLAALEAIEEIAIVAVPDIMPKPVESVRYRKIPARCAIVNPTPEPPPSIPQTPPEFPPPLDVFALESSVIAHCEKLKDRVAVLDARRDDRTTDQIRLFRKLLTQSSYAGLYFPWIMTPDPLALEGLLRPVPPCGHVAGIYARVDRRTGVHKPPANEILLEAEDVTVAVDDIAHGALNDAGINVIRLFNGRQIRIGGERTLADPDDPQWTYINVRRLLIMIERSILSSTHWTVFEPNNPNLWRELDRVVRSFLQGLWQRGFLDGSKPEEAYSVQCDQSTNPPWETDQGRMICEIGVLPPWPAEFVIVRIGLTATGVELVNATEAQIA